MPSNLIMSKVFIIFKKECLSCSIEQYLTTMWSNVAHPNKDNYFCKGCCYNEQEARELYIEYVIGPKPNVRPPPQGNYAIL